MNNKRWKCFYHNKDKVLFAKYDFGQVVVSDGENCIFRYIIDKVTGIAYFDSKLVISIEGSNKLVFIDKKHDESKEITIEGYHSVEIIKLVTGHDSFVVLKGTKDHQFEYLIFDLINNVKLVTLPLKSGFIDLAYVDGENALLLCEAEQEVSGRYSDEIPDTKIVFFAVVEWKNDCRQAKITDSITLYIDNNYDVPDKLLYSGDLRFPLFDQYLYHWLKQKSFSLNGRFVVYYSEDIKGIIVGNPIGGEIYRIISLPDELASSNNDFVYNYYTQELFVITNDNDIRRLYIRVRSNKAIDKLNSAYNKAYRNKQNLSKMKSEGSLEFTNILFSAINSCSCEDISAERDIMLNDAPIQGQAIEAGERRFHEVDRKMLSYIGKSGKVYTVITPPLGAGSEGTVYRVSDMQDCVIHIYCDEKRTEARHRQLLAMISMALSPVSMKRNIMPIDVVYQDGSFVGYVILASKNNEDIARIDDTSFETTDEDSPQGSGLTEPREQDITELKHILDEINSIKNMLKHISNLSTKLSTIDDEVQRLQSISEQVQKIDTRTSSMDEKLDIIDNRLKDLELWLKSVSDIVERKKASLAELDQSKTEHELEEMRSAFISATAREIANIACRDTASVDYEESQLKGLFGDCWDMLDSYTRHSLISAKVFASNCRKTSYQVLDYSGIIVSATSALENELKLRFFIGYQDYLLKTYGEPSADKWPASMLFTTKKGKVVRNSEFTLGSLPYIFDCSDKDRVTLEGYLKTIVDSQYISNAINSLYSRTSRGHFVSRCENVRVKYRNKAAHTEPVSMELAENCCSDVIGLQVASEHIGQVQGLLLDLVRITSRYGC